MTTNPTITAALAQALRTVVERYMLDDLDDILKVCNDAIALYESSKTESGVTDAIAEKVLSIYHDKLPEDGVQDIWPPQRALEINVAAMRAALEAVWPLLSKSEPGAVGMVCVPRESLNELVQEMYLADCLAAQTGNVHRGYVYEWAKRIEKLAAAPAQAAPAEQAAEVPAWAWREAHKRFWEENSSDVLYAIGPSKVFDVHIAPIARELSSARDGMADAQQEGQS